MSEFVDDISGKREDFDDQEQSGDRSERTPEERRRLDRRRRSDWKNMLRFCDHYAKRSDADNDLVYHKDNPEAAIGWIWYEHDCFYPLTIDGKMDRSHNLDMRDWLYEYHFKKEPTLYEDPAGELLARLGCLLYSDDTDDDEPETESSESSEPIPLESESMPPAQAFPFDDLGKTLAPAAKELHRVIQATDSVCGISVLSASSLSVQAYYDLEIDGRVQPLSEFYTEISKASQRKSTVDKQSTEPHDRFEEYLEDQANQSRNSYQNAVLVYNKEKERIMNSKNDKNGKPFTPSSRCSELDELGLPPTPPLGARIKTSEPTYQGLYRLFQESYPSLGLFSHEGGRFAGGYALQKENICNTASSLSEFWDGRDPDRDRGGDGNSKLRGKRLSINLMMTPVVAQMMLRDPLLRGQGLLSRFNACFTIPTETKEYIEENVSAKPEVRDFQDRLHSILKRPLPIKSGTHNQLQPNRLKLSHEAKKLYMQFHNECQRRLMPNEDLAEIEEYAGKAHDHAARIAATIQLVDEDNVLEISPEYMIHGINLVRYFMNEWLRFYSLHSLSEEMQDAKKLLEWVTREDCSLFSLREIQRGPIRGGGEESKKRRQKAVQVLIDHKWICKHSTMKDHFIVLHKPNQ